MTSLIFQILILTTSMASPNLDGRWQAQYAELAGKPFPDAVTQTILLTLKNGEYNVQNDQGTTRFLGGNKMEITGTGGPNQGKTLKAIYQLEDDRLTICYDLSGSSFPSMFATHENTKLFLVNYLKIK